MESPDSANFEASPKIAVKVDLSVTGTESLMKACYWFSGDFVCEIHKTDETEAEVVLRPRKPTSAAELASRRDDFISSVMDFALRERIEAKTASIRDLLIAKALSEAGILEDEPVGVFGDAIEESKTDGMFKILGNL